LAAVVGLLADEAADLLQLLRVADPVAEGSHRVDEEALALGEQQRHGVEEVALEGIVTVPVALPRLGQGKARLAWANLQLGGGGAGHRGLPSCSCGLATMVLQVISGQGYLQPYFRSYPAITAMNRTPALHAELAPLAYAEALLALAEELGVPR